MTAEPDAPTDAMVEVAGVALRVVDRVIEPEHPLGPSPAPLTFVVLHGFTGSVEAMEPLCALLTGRVVGIDLLGHGASAAPTVLDPYSMDACVEQVLGVLDRLGLDRVHLIGYSMGGRVALSMAARGSDRLETVHLIGATAGLRTAEERRARRAADEALARRIVEHGLDDFIDFWMALPLFASQASLGPDALSKSRDQRLRSDPIGLANSLRGLGTGAMPPLYDKLGSLEIETQIIVGDQDEKFCRIGAELASMIPHASVMRIPGAGHAAHLEQPAAVAQAILQTVAR